MSDLKTQPTTASVTAFVSAIDDRERREDCRMVMRVMRRVTGKRPRMWGESIIGYGSYHYRYASGREGDWFLTGVSPRKRDFSIYVMPELRAHAELLDSLGRHRSGVCCLYVKRLSDIDVAVLETLLSRSVTTLREHYVCR